MSGSHMNFPFFTTYSRQSVCSHRVPPNTVDVVLSYCHACPLDDTLLAQLPYLQSKGVGVINASPLSMGLLSPQVCCLRCTQTPNFPFSYFPLFLRMSRVAMYSLLPLVSVILPRTFVPHTNGTQGPPVWHPAPPAVKEAAAAATAAAAAAGSDIAAVGLRAAVTIPQVCSRSTPVN